MVSKNDILLFLKENRALFERDFNLTKIGLMGSFSRNEETSDSDLDVIVEFKSGTLDLVERKEKLKKTIQKKFGKKVDVCRVKYLKPYFKNRILKDAIFV
jgi:uncharacterized protein